MSANPKLDREAFQQLLANAFAIQESRIDPRFLSAMLNVQRMVAKGELGADGAMNLVVDSARDVAGAAGAAVGLLQGDQLIYRAGSGCSRSHVGSHVAASFTVSAKTKITREILRVENARTDTRVEGAICRQFGAESLLILPLYMSAAPALSAGRDQPLGGVLMVLFSTAHAFQDSEIRMYRLMAGLLETAIGHSTQAPVKAPGPIPALSKVVAIEFERFERKAPLSVPAFQDAGPVFYQGRSDGFYVRCKGAVASVRKSTAFRRSGALAEVAVQRAAQSISSNPLRGLAVAAVVVGLGLTLWLSHGNRGISTPPVVPGVQDFGASNRSRPEKEVPVEVESASPVEPSERSQTRRNLASARIRHAAAGTPEVEYIGDDVTVRHFTPQTSPQRKPGSARVSYIGNDVTVRYFTPAVTSGRGR